MRLVEEAVAAGLEFRGAAISPALERTERGASLHHALERRGVVIEAVSEPDLSDLADTDTPQGVIAVIEHPRWSAADLELKGGRAILVLDAVQDPGNVGALVRTAFALAAGGVILLPGTARLTHPKVLRGAMGSTFRLPTVPLTVAQLRAWLGEQQVTLWATAVGGEDVRQVARPERVAVVVGNEGIGVSPEVQSLADLTVSVAVARQVDSLNVAVAAGILLHEVLDDT